MSINYKKIIKKKLNLIKHNLYKFTDLNYKYVILLFHRVLNDEIEDPVNNYILTEEFYEQINFLNNNYDIISFDQINNLKPDKKIKIIISFDDGYKDNYNNAYPILKQFNNNAIFFVLANYINKKKLIWDRELCLIYNYALKNDKLIKFKNSIKVPNFSEEKIKNIWQYINYLKKLKFEKIENIILDLKKEINYEDNYQEEDCPMSWKELSILNNNKMTIGSHGLNHLSLTNLSYEDSFLEITESKKMIEENLNINCKYFSFPFGNKLDFNEKLVNLCIKSGYKKCFLNQQKYNHVFNRKKTEERIITFAGKNLKHILA